MKKRILFFIVLFILSFYVFKDSFSTFFFQDDFFVLAASNIKNISSFANFFIPRGDVQFYRPLSHEIFFFLGRNLFHLNPVGFHMISFVFYILNLFLVFLLAKKFLKSKLIIMTLMTCYAISAVHYNSLFWIVNFSYIEVTFFFLLAFVILLSNFKKINKIVLTLLVYTIGLLSNEFMITFPIILLFYIFLLERSKVKYYVSLIFALAGITFGYLVLRFIIFKPDFGTYQFIFNKSVISSYRWFTLFFFNWPETMKDHMMTFYKVSPSFLKSFSGEYYLFVVNLIIPILFCIIFPLILIIREKKLEKFIRSKIRIISFFTFWFLATLLPIIFVPSHISPHQGSIALFGFLMLLLIPLDFINSKNLNLTVMMILLLVWFVGTTVTVGFNNKYHWIVRRSNIARYWVDKANKTYKKLPDAAVLIIPSEDKEVKVALSDGRAFQVYYNDSIKTIFSTDSAKLKAPSFFLLSNGT